VTPIRIDDLDDESLEVVKALLPSSADDFVMLIGLRPTLALIGAMGGRDIKFPCTGKSEVARDIEQIVGPEHTKSLQEYFGGGEAYLPTAHRALIALRNLRIIADFDQLTTEISCREAVLRLSRQYRLSDRTIENVVNKWAPPTRK
jgi:hypothetical protein